MNDHYRLNYIFIIFNLYYHLLFLHKIKNILNFMISYHTENLTSSVPDIQFL
jgi:hypothetical protein